MLLLLACVADPPAAELRCDGKDDDGDGVVDEGVEPTWYADGDGDGYGTNATALTSCEAPEGYTAAAGDCDDGDSTAHPGTVETCGAPGVDEDCDGTADPAGAAGCVDTWPDADGDGLGEGEPSCVCDPGDALLVGGDCDGTDVDRGADCSEGDVLPLDGPRILGDGGAYWSLLGAGAMTADGDDALAFVSNTQRFAVTTIPATGDVALADAALAITDTPTWSRPTLGDVDGDGLVDLLVPSGESLPDDDGTYTHLPTLSVTAGPLAAASGPAWTVDLDPVHGAGATESLFVADLDGDDVPEAWYVLGSGPGAPGQVGAWRVDGGEVTVVAEPDDEAPGRHTLVVPLGDIDGDGISDLGSLSDAGLSAHLGPIADTLPEEADATATIVTPPLRDVVPLGDLDGDGLDDVGIREARIWLVTTVTSGDLADVARARIGPETDTDGESALFVDAGDVGADGARELLVTDTFWPRSTGAGNLRGALYVFDTLPTGVVDARAAERRVEGDDYALFGAFPTVLADGRVAVGAPLVSTDVGTGVVWVLDL